MFDAGDPQKRKVKSMEEDRNAFFGNHIGSDKAKNSKSNIGTIIEDDDDLDY